MACNYLGVPLASFIDKLLRAGEGRLLRKLQSYADQVNALESDFKLFSDEELKGETTLLRERYAAGETLDDLLPEAFAAVREASVRTIGLRHFDVQLMGGAALHLGNIAEMKTGEGKTLVATLAAYLNAIPGQGVHVVTVNDFLAGYQSELMGRIFRALGMTTGCIIVRTQSLDVRSMPATLPMEPTTNSALITSETTCLSPRATSFSEATSTQSLTRSTPF
jgi:preprotein translocase subunit SecA